MHHEQHTKTTLHLSGWPRRFFPNAQERYDSLEGLCASRGLVGHAPSDAGIAAMIAANVAPQDIARHIYVSNLGLIQNCEAVLANMAPFRGDIEPDSGTVFEVGMAIAMGKPVALYLPHGLEDSGNRVRRICGHNADGTDGRYGALIEDFGLPLNLMLACSSAIFATPEEALDHLHAVLFIDSAIQ